MALWKKILIGVAALPLIAVGGLAAMTFEHRFRRFDTPLPVVRIAASQGDLAEGKRVGMVFGCLACHDPNGAGRVMIEDPMLGRIAAPNLTKVVPKYTDAQFVRLLRSGVRHDGSSTIVMPTRSFGSLSDQDIASVLRYLRSLPETPDNGKLGMRWGPVGMIALSTGGVPLSATQAVDAKPPLQRPMSGPTNGDYWINTTCTHCHALDEPHPIGDGKTVAPPLRAVVNAYSEDELIRMFRTGRSLGGAPLGVMGIVVKDARYLSDDEIRNIHKALAPDRAKAAPKS